MRIFFWLAALPLGAHTISMSTGTLSVEGTRADYVLRMPLYEAAHAARPEILMQSLRLKGAELVSQACERGPAEMVCRGVYRFSSAPETVEVECKLARVTVPNHMHLLRATKNGRPDQAMFDISFEKLELKFRSPSPFETALKEVAAGALRVFTGAASLLFLLSIALAAGTPRSLGALFAAFVAGEAAGLILPRILSWYPHPRFIEAAMALTIAYLAVEILMLPAARGRWAVVALLGIFHGMYFQMLIQQGSLGALTVMTGAVLAESVAIAALWWLMRAVQRYASKLRPAPVAAGLLLAIGLGWFALRLIS